MVAYLHPQGTYILPLLLLIIACQHMFIMVHQIELLAQTQSIVFKQFQQMVATLNKIQHIV